MKKPDVIVAALNGTRRNQLFIHTTESFDEQGKFAYDLMKTYACAAVPDGETSTGNVNLRMVTPAEAVEHVMTVTRLFFEEIDKAGWTIKYPGYAEMEATETNEPSSPGFRR